jgi:hypothetical protein
VICSSASGHVAIESALADDCCGAAHDPTPAVSRGPDCGDCTDVPLGKTLVQRNESTDHTASARPQLSASLLPPPVDAATRPRPAASPHEPAVAGRPPALLALRAVVLVV